jgi:hypothetical protein
VNVAQEAALGALNERSLVKKRLLDDEGFPIPDDGSSHFMVIIYYYHDPNQNRNMRVMRPPFELIF